MNNYIKVKTIDDRYFEVEKTFEVTFDKYGKINVIGNGAFNRWFEYKGRSIIRLKKYLDSITVKPKGDHWTIYDWAYKDCFLEILEIHIPDNPKENEIFDNYPDLNLGMCEDFITDFLPQFKSDVQENVKKEPNSEWNIELRYNCTNDWRAYVCICGTYGYNKFGKPKCKIRRFWCNPGGRFSFGVDRYYFTMLQNLIKEYVESV